MDNLAQAIGLAFRRLIRRKTYSAIVILCLAFGIGANAAIFSVINTLLLRPLPVKDVDQVVFTLDMRTEDDPFEASLLDAVAFKNESRLFTGSGLGLYRVFRLLDKEKAERVNGAAISSDYLTTLGIEPLLGRAFLPSDDRPGAAPVALLSKSMWESHFGASAEILGRTLNLDNQNYTVIGVLPSGFDLPLGTKIWVPLAINIETLPLKEQIANDYFLVARLKPGVSLQQANAGVKGIAQRLEQDYPQWRKGWSIKLIPLRQQLLGDITGNIRPTLFLLMAIVGFLLLITCANVASLLLARSVERSHETVVQIALGAGRRHLISQLLVESVLLSLIGGAVGLFLARLATTSLMALKPVYFFAMKEVFQDVRTDGRVLLFTFLISLVTAILFGLVPLARTTYPSNLSHALQESGQRTGGGAGGRRLFDLLVISEIAVVTVMLIGMVVVVRSFQRLTEAKLGFRPDRLLTVEMYLPESDYQEHWQRVEFSRRILEKVKNLPGVKSAGTTTNAPLTIATWDSGYTVEGKPPLNTAETPMTSHRLVSPAYLETLGVTLLSGRLIEERDQAAAAPVVVISKEFAKRAWPDEDPIGKRVKPGRQPDPATPWFTVVGVVDDVKEDRFNFRIDRPVWYLPYAQRNSSQPLILVARTAGDPLALAGLIRDVIRSVNKNQPISEVETMEGHLNAFLGPQRFTALLSALLAGFGLFLAAVGIYGVTSYSVMQRTQEFSIRMALGARWGDLVRMTLKRGVKVALLGLTIGSAIGFALSRTLNGMFYQVTLVSPEVLLIPAGVLLIVVLMAMFLPMVRLVMFKPIQGLRHQ